MTLDVWLRETGTTDTAFARTIGVTQQAVGLWRRGERRPLPECRERIREATGGMVTFDGEEGKG